MTNNNNVPLSIIVTIAVTIAMIIVVAKATGELIDLCAHVLDLEVPVVRLPHDELIHVVHLPDDLRIIHICDIASICVTANSSTVTPAPSSAVVEQSQHPWRI